MQQYVELMVGDLGHHRGLSTIEFEALGQMGWKHSSHHDKASFQPSGLLDAALSACFCDRCEAAMQNGGSDPAACRVAGTSGGTRACGSRSSRKARRCATR